MLKRFSDVLNESTFEQTKEEARKFLKKKYPKYEIVYTSKDFKEEDVIKRKKYNIYIAGAETASGKDAVMFDIEFV